MSDVEGVVSKSSEKKSQPERLDRWQSLVYGAFLLEEARSAGQKRSAQAMDAGKYLDSILEVFPAGLDPVEDFEGYAVRRLALALRRDLDERGK